MLSAILLCALAANEGPAAPPEGPPKIEAPVNLYGWHFAGVPVLSYGSDVGFTFGAALFLYRTLPEHPDEHRNFTLTLSYATRGPRAVDTTFDFPRVLGTSLRTTLNIHAADDDLMPYWGEGADLGGLPVAPGYGTPPEPYRYHDRRLFLTGILRAAIAGPVGWHLRGRFLDVGVVRQSTLLASSDPAGARGGRVALGELGLWYDTRDREIGPHSGVFVTASAFVAPQVNGLSDFSFHGYDAVASAYVPLSAGITLALRGLYDRKIAGVPFLGGQQQAAVPFFERMLYEGLTYGEGLGGAGTIRGIALYRISGDEKILGNIQLRATVVTTHLMDRTQEWGIEVGADAGRARQPGYPAVEAIGFTGGLRLIWDHAILTRLEVGRAPGGENTLYLAFGEQF